MFKVLKVTGLPGGSSGYYYWREHPVAVWYHSGKPPVPIRWVVVRLEKKLTGLIGNDSRLAAEQIITYFVGRWPIATPFALVRAHLGVETQRQWSELAIARTTPMLMGLFSVVTLLAHSLQTQDQPVGQTSSWYVKDSSLLVMRWLGSDGIYGGK